LRSYAAKQARHLRVFVMFVADFEANSS